MPSRSDLLDELLRLTQEYKRDDAARRVPMLDAAQMAQPAGNALALPETPQAGPDIDEFAYLGKPSPPVEGTPGMPAMTRPPIKMPGLLDPRTAPSLPEGYSYWDDGSVKDPDGNPARFEGPSRGKIANDIGLAAFTGPRAGMNALALAGKGATGLWNRRDEVGPAVRSALSPVGQGPMDPSVPELPGSHGGMSAARAAQLLKLMQDYMRGPEAPARPVAMGIRG